MQRLTIDSEPDAFGFIAAEYLAATGQRHSVNIMPPRSRWAGLFIPHGFHPHATDFVVYADSTPIVRATEIAGLERELQELDWWV